MEEHISNAYLSMLIAHLRRLDTDHAALFSELGISHYLERRVDTEGSISIHDFLDLNQRIEAVTGNPLFAAEAGMHIHPGDIGIMGFMLMSCKNYQQAIDFGYRYQTLVNSCLCRYPGKEGDQVLTILDDHRYQKDYVRPYAEMEFASLVHISHFITGNMFRGKVPITLSFRHEKVASDEEYQRIFQVPLAFGQEHTQFKMHEIVLEAPLYAYNESVQKLVLGQVDEMETHLAHERGIANQVASYIQLNIVHSVPKLEDCAASFGISASTLKRKLNETETSYQDILDHVRFSISKNMLANKDMSLNDISCVLGFSEVSAFSRAFKRWAGVTPKHYRKEYIKN